MFSTLVLPGSMARAFASGSEAKESNSFDGFGLLELVSPSFSNSAWHFHPRSGELIRFVVAHFDAPRAQALGTVLVPWSAAVQVEFLANLSFVPSRGIRVPNFDF